MSASPSDLKKASEGRLAPDRVLAIIPALNEADHIETCIRSLMQGHAWLRDVALVVADGGSRDDTTAIVAALMTEFPNLSLIHNPARVQAAAINLAAETCATKITRYLVRCDAHSIYPEDFIWQVAQALEQTQAASVVIAMDAVGRSCFEKANAWIVDTPLGSGGAAHRGGRVSGYVDHGHHAGFDLAMFKSLGGYDASFSHNEDAEYDERVNQAGGRVFLDANIRIQYIPRGRVTSLARQYFSYGKGRARTISKHHQRLKTRQALPIFALLASVLGLAVGGLFPPALILPVGYVFVLIIASIGVALWQRSWCGLFAGFASGVIHMSWATGFLAQFVRLFARHK